jgi:single-strand DNA-binding protein
MATQSPDAQSPSRLSSDLDDPADVSVALVTGRLSRAAETRELPSGDTLVALEVTSRRTDGAAESVPVVWLAAPAWATRLAAGERVVVAGRVRRRFYRAGGVTASRTEVVAERVAPLRQRARSRAVVESVRATVAAPVATVAGPVG